MKYPIKRVGFPAAMATLLLAGSSCLAQYRLGEPASAAQSPYYQQAPQRQQVRGQVLRTRRINLGGTNAVFLAALVETDDGRQLVVDLGPIPNLRDHNIQIRTGDEIVARGSFSRVGNAPVLLANRVQTDGQTVNISREELPSEQRLQREEDLLETYARYQERGRGYGEFQGQEGAYPYSQYQNPSGSFSREQQLGQAQQFRGHITRTSQIQLPGMEDKLLFAQVQTDQGWPASVYLGPVPDLEHIQINRGDQINVRGPVLEVHGQPIMLARQFRIHGHSVPIAQRAREEATAASNHIQGHIERTRTVRIPGINEPLLIALVRTNEGRSIITELGPESRLEGLTLNQGDQVDVRGRAFRVENYRILLAERVRAHGQTVTIEQLRQRAGAPGPRARLIRIFARDFRFEPPTITAQPGELLNIELTNWSGDLPHSIVFDLPGEEIGLQRPLQPGDTHILTLRAPEAPGRYAFYCPVDDHAERGMEGYLIVRTPAY